MFHRRERVTRFGEETEEGITVGERRAKERFREVDRVIGREVPV